MIAAQVGWLAGLLALAATLYSAVALGRGASRRDPLWLSSGRNGLAAATALLGLGLVLLTYCFLTNQFQVSYVASHSSRELPLYLKLTALWAGQEGSLLVWSFLQALFALLVVRSLGRDSSPLAAWAGVCLSAIASFFIAITLFRSNPFALSALIPANGAGMSPLLRHPGMIFHPPALYVGYVALAVPFALALSALITGRFAQWPQAARRWLLVAWLFLGLGIFLGARWAYDVLGWGGYWGWDPVENAALMPWLVSTALLHSLAIQQERGAFRGWNLILAVISFLFVLFGTFATRSGLIESVHAFARSSLGYYFLGFMVVVVVVSLYLGRRYRAQLRSAASGSSSSLLSREGMFFLTLVVLSAITLSVLVGSTLPTITEALGGNPMEAGPEWFDRVTGPQFAVLVFLMGVCPLAGYSADAVRRLGRRLVIPLAGAAIVLVASALLGFLGVGSLIGFALVGLAATTTLAEFWHVIARRPAGESPLGAIARGLARNRRRYGGYLVHLGIILMAVGVIGTRMHSTEGRLSLRVGEPRTFGDYTFVYESAGQEQRVDHWAIIAAFDVYRNGAYLTTLQPQLHEYQAADQTVNIPALKVGVEEDLYLVLGGVSNDGSSATVRVVIDPLINFLWLGGLVFIAGGVVSLWPASAPAVGLAERRRALTTWATLLLGVAAFAVAAYAMWGGDKGEIGRAVGRPLVGEPAPGFFVTGTDGTRLSLDVLKGRVAVVNFWASWCRPCEEELPALQAAWEEYAPQGVGFVGLAYQEKAESVSATVRRFGITFPMALDHGEAIAASYGITGIPETFVLDREGRVAYVHIGPVTEEQLSSELDTLLAQAVTP